MAESVKSFMKIGMIRTIGSAFMLTSTCVSWSLAENLLDPTRPPAALYALQGSSSSMQQSGPVLQSIFISAGKKTAIVNGHELKVGDKLGEARVAKITESEVVLQEGKSTQTLKLFPGVEKLSSSHRAADSFELRRK